MTLRGIRAVWFALAVALLATFILPLLSVKHASAATLTSRSLTLQAGTTDGGSKPSGVVKHLFSFTTATTANIGSIQFLYCTTAGGTCTTPPGLSTTSATYGTNSGAAFTSIVNTTNGAPYLTRSAANINSGTAITEQLATVTNPSAANSSFYVRITTFTSTDATSGAISFNQLFSPADTATATSQLAASTNAGSGYSITVNGTTLTSGGNTVTAMGSSTTGVRGTSQFGMNLVANTTTTSTPAIGSNLAPASNGTNYKGQALTGYSTTDNFKFVTGDTVANSAASGAGPSDIQTYTVSYIVNANGAQAIGTYTTTLTYICTATY
jgi:hypothetical protein